MTQKEILSGIKGGDISFEDACEAFRQAGLEPSTRFVKCAIRAAQQGAAQDFAQREEFYRLRAIKALRELADDLEQDEWLGRRCSHGAPVSSKSVAWMICEGMDRVILWTGEDDYPDADAVVWALTAYGR